MVGANGRVLHCPIRVPQWQLVQRALNTSSAELLFFEMKENEMIESIALQIYTL
jgi:hypothetical protein